MVIQDNLVWTILLVCTCRTILTVHAAQPYLTDHQVIDWSINQMTREWELNYLLERALRTYFHDKLENFNG